MFGPLARNDRKCVKDWQGEGEFAHINIPRGTLIRLAYHLIHHDQEYWPDPEQFMPERFLKENATDIIPHTYRPFGGIWEQATEFIVAQRSPPFYVVYVYTLKGDRGSASARGSPSPS